MNHREHELAREIRYFASVGFYKGEAPAHDLLLNSEIAYCRDRGRHIHNDAHNLRTKFPWIPDWAVHPILKGYIAYRARKDARRF